MTIQMEKNTLSKNYTDFFDPKGRKVNMIYSHEQLLNYFDYSFL